MGCVLLVGCNNEPNYAPVTEINTIESIPPSGKHKVMHGETLYEIAWRYGLDYRYVAVLNHMTPPYTLFSGQVLVLSGKSNQLLPVEKIQMKPVAEIKPVVSPVEKSWSEPRATVTQWIWPAQGKVIATFSKFNKGINIVGQLGEPIRASAAGKIVYCGDGLRGYGNLIIIKHNSTYLSAYAHNRTIFVQEGEWVRQGQKIAEMGNSGAEAVLLHFEIRKNGQPIDPLAVLVTPH